MSVRLIIIDESSTIQKIVKLALEGQDFEVHGFSKGLDAMGKMEEIKPAMVLVDADLPGISGYELSKRIKASLKFSSVSVLLLIGDSAGLNQGKYRESGADGYLEKPFKAENLVRRVKEILNIGGGVMAENPDGLSPEADEAMDDLMKDIIGESGAGVEAEVEAEAPGVEEGMDPVDEGSDLPGDDDMMAAMDDIMNDIIGDSGVTVTPTEDAGDVMDAVDEVEAGESLPEDDAMIGMDDLMSDIIGESGVSATPVEPVPAPRPEPVAAKPAPSPAPAVKPAPVAPEPKPVKAQTPPPAPPEEKEEDMSLEDLLNSAEALLEDNYLEQEVEKTLRGEPKEAPAAPEAMAAPEGERILADSADMAEEVAGADELDAVFATISQFEEEEKVDAAAVKPSAPPPVATPEPIRMAEPPKAAPVISPEPPPAPPVRAQDSMAEVSPEMEPGEDLDSVFESIQSASAEEEPEPALPTEGNGAGHVDPRSAFAEDMALLEIKPEPEDLLAHLAPSAFTAASASASARGKPDLVEETLSYLSDLAPRKKAAPMPVQPPVKAAAPKAPEPAIEKPVQPKETPMSTEPKGDLFVQIVGEHIKRILERSLKESIAKEISGLSSTIERSVREIVKEVTPEIARSIIQEEIEKIRNLEEV